jgi:hypothetical protein
MKGDELKELIEECMKDSYEDKNGKTHLCTWTMVKRLRNKAGDIYTIVTDPVPEMCTDRIVVVSSKILKDGKIVSSGMASCNRIEKDAVEIAETKAVGRALSFFGMLVDSIAPKESMEHYEKSMGVKGSYIFKPAPTSNDDPLDDPLPTTSPEPLKHLKSTKSGGVVNIEGIKSKLSSAENKKVLDELWKKTYREDIDTLIKTSPVMYKEVYNAYDVRRTQIKNKGVI